MFRRNLIPVWLGIILLSGMFLMGQDTWSPPCVELDPDGYGVCEMILGVVFDGQDCVLASGCGCEPDCEYFFDDFETCQSVCLSM